MREFIYPKKQGVLPNVFPGISISRALYLTEDESYRTRDGVAKSLRFALSDYFPINTREYYISSKDRSLEIVLVKDSFVIFLFKTG